MNRRDFFTTVFFYIIMVCAIALTAVTFNACSGDDDDKKTDNPFIGTWEKDAVTVTITETMWAAKEGTTTLASGTYTYNKITALLQVTARGSSNAEVGETATATLTGIGISAITLSGFSDPVLNGSFTREEENDSDSVKIKLVSKICYTESRGIQEMTFQYDTNGLLTKAAQTNSGIAKGDEYISTITRFENTITETYTSSTSFNNRTVTHTLNSAGYIVQTKDIQSADYTFICTFSYNGKGQLIKEESTEYDYTNVYESAMVYTWVSDNLVSAIATEENYTVTWTYTDKENKTNLDFTWLKYDFPGVHYLFVNNLGKSGKYYPATHSDNIKGEMYSCEYRYTYDNDGCPTTIKCYEGNNLYGTYTIEY